MVEQELEILKRKLERERSARKKAEEILEQKSLELYSANKQLVQFNSALELKVQEQVQLAVASELRLKTLLDSIEDAIFNVDLDGCLTYVNAYAVSISGYSQNELIGMHFSNLISPEFKPYLVSYFEEAESQSIDKSYFEFQLITKSGELKWIGQKVTLLNNSDSQFYTAVARDISETKETQEQLAHARAVLEQSEHKYRNIIENMELGLLEADIHGHVIKAYPLFCKMFGFSEEELIGQKPEEFLLDKKNLALFYKHQELRKQGESSVYELEITKKNGKKAFVLLSGAPFYNVHNEIAGSIGIHYDITDRKHLEEELKKSKNIAERAQEAQKQFLANMSHEMRTPLNAIIGMTHLLKDTELNNEQQELLKILFTSASLLLSLISDILDFSKIEAGIVEVQQKPFSLASLTNDLYHSFSNNFKEKDISVKLELDDRVFPYLIGDELLINQVLINLTNNACKFTKSGTVTIKVEVEHDDPEYQILLLSVIDTGIGIDEDKLQEIFKDFVQEDVTIKEHYGGTGLGLAISKRLINVMGSEIQVASKKDQGSTFSFNLSLNKKYDHKVDNTSLIVEDLDALSKDIRVLIVEDNKMNINYICRLMHKWKLNYSLANNGQEAIDLCLINKYDIILMDLQMPVMDGITASKHIRKYLTEYKDIPIIALTASTLLTKKNLALSAGMSDFLAKPFSPGQLSKVIFHHLGTTPIITEKEIISQTKIDDLDREYIDSLYGDDIEYKIDMFEIFLSQIDEEIEALEKAYEAQDFDQLAKISHKIKPGMAMVGLTDIQKTLNTLEKACKESSKTLIHDTYRKFSESFTSKKLLIQNELSIFKS